MVSIFLTVSTLNSIIDPFMTLKCTIKRLFYYIFWNYFENEFLINLENFYFLHLLSLANELSFFDVFSSSSYDFSSLLLIFSFDYFSGVIIVFNFLSLMLTPAIFYLSYLSIGYSCRRSSFVLVF